MHGWMKIQKYTNSKGKYLNKAFYKSINLNNRIIPIKIIHLELSNIILLELLKKLYLQKLLKLQKIKLLWLHGDKKWCYQLFQLQMNY